MNFSNFSECDGDLRGGVCTPWNVTLQYVRDYLFPDWGEWVFIFLFVLVFICGIVGNVLVCVVVLSYSHMRSVTNIFILNLAVSDLLVLFIVLIPTMIQDIFESWFFGSAICPIANYLQRVSPMVSILTLTFISIERLYAVCDPLKFEATKKRACAMILAIWVISFLSAIPDALYSEVYREFPAHITDLLSNCKAVHSNGFYYFYTGVFFVLPCLIMGVAYFKIARCLWMNPIDKLSSGESSGLTAGGMGAQIVQRRKVAKMLFAVVVCFFCCFAVHHIILMLYLHLPSQRWNLDVHIYLIILGHLLIYVNSALNPLIYNFMSEKFRMAFLETCRCCIRRGSSPSEQIKLRSSKFSPSYQDETKVSEI